MDPELNFGGPSDPLYVFSCKKFLNAVVCYRKCYHLFGRALSSPLDLPLAMRLSQLITQMSISVIMKEAQKYSIASRQEDVFKVSALNKF